MKFDKLISASYTPFKESNKKLDLNKIEALYNNLTNNGIQGTMVCGTTGEGYSMSTTERMELASTWASVVSDDFDLMVHVGHNSLVEIKELVESAVGLSSTAIVLSPPIFHKPTDIGNLVDFLSECIGDDPHTDFYYYHIPSMTGVEFSMLDFLETLRIRGINIRGIKFTHDNLEEYGDCLNYNDSRFDMIFGRDEQLFEAMKKGALSALGSTYNFMAPIYLKMIRLFEAGNLTEAETMHWEINKIIDVLIEFGGGMVAGKAFMGLIGLDCGPVRLPLRTLKETDMDSLSSKLRKTAFYDYMNIQPTTTFNN